MTQKYIRLTWLDWFANDHFRRRHFLRWIWRWFFARKYALHDWQTVIEGSILWEQTVGCDENQLVNLVSSWLYKALQYWHPDGPEAAIDILLDTIYRRAGWFAVNWGPKVIPEHFPLILKVAKGCVQDFIKTGKCVSENAFVEEVRKRVQAQSLVKK